jgi:hypothetical protein
VGTVRASESCQRSNSRLGPTEMRTAIQQQTRAYRDAYRDPTRTEMRTEIQQQTRAYRDAILQIAHYRALQAPCKPRQCNLVARDCWLLESDKHRTSQAPASPVQLVARGCWLLEREECRTSQAPCQPRQYSNQIASISSKAPPPFVLDGIHGGNGKRQWAPEWNAIGRTHGSASIGAKA